MKEFNNRVAVITGGASGIGRSLALNLAKRGVTVALADKNMEGLEETRKMVIELGGTASIHELDVSDYAAFSALAHTIELQHGQVHMLFNNAGVTLIDRASEQSLEDFHWLMNINFWGVVYGCKAFLPTLAKADEAIIINVSSLFGLLALPLQSAYNASKFAVRGYTEALRTEMSGSSIQVTCVHPGGIKTDITKNAKVSDSAIGISKDQLNKDFEKLAKTTSEQAAQIIISGIEKNNPRILVGPDAKVMDFIVRLFPAKYTKLLGFEKSVLAKRKKRDLANKVCIKNA
jgi:short-subunit dehydrogenase